MRGQIDGLSPVRPLAKRCESARESRSAIPPYLFTTITETSGRFPSASDYVSEETGRGGAQAPL